MSRSNSKVALLLREREAETTRINKTVQKAGGLASDSKVFDVLDESNAKYEEKMSRLLQFTSKSKKVLKVQNHKTEWIDEQLRLQLLAKKIEMSVGSILDAATVELPDDEDLHEVMDCMNGYLSARKKNQTELANQLRNIKEMLKESIKRGNVAPKATRSETDENKNMAIESIIAELFIKLRTDHAKVWKYWQKQEAELRAEVQQAAHKLALDIRTDSIVTQDAQLRAEFAHILSLSSSDKEARIGVVNRGSNESVAESMDTTGQPTLELDLELLMDMRLQKIAILDKAQEIKVIEREQERASFCVEIGLDPDPSDHSGGWAEVDHDTFVKIYRKAQVTGMQRKRMLEILKAELPHVALDVILTHEEWYRKMKLLSAKYRESEALYSTTRQDLIAQAKANLLEHRAHKLELLERLRESEMHEKHRAEIHARLSELHAAKESFEQSQSEQRRAQEVALQQRLQAQEEALRQEHLEKKQQVERFRILREQAEAEAKAAQEAQAKAAQEHLRQLIEQNKPKVERRAQLVNEKEDKKRQKEVLINTFNVFMLL